MGHVRDSSLPDEEPLIRVAVVGEPGLFRTLVAGVLAATPDFEVLGETEPGPAGMRRLAARRPDLALVDLDAVGDLAAVLGSLRTDVPECAVVVLTARPTARVLRRAIEARVRGVVAKDVPPEELIAQLRAAAEGRRAIDPVAALAALDTAVNPLSDREREVAAAAAKGLRTREIAQLLHLAPGTVRNNLSGLLRKAGGRNRWEAVRRAQEAGWI